MGFYESSCLVEEQTPRPSSPFLLRPSGCGGQVGLRRDLRKNRVVGSRAFSFDRAPFPASQPPESHQVPELTLTIIVSDRQRFWTVDAWSGSTRSPLSLHRYMYANADPINGVDPSGQITLPEMAIASAISGMFAAQVARRVSPFIHGTGTLPSNCAGGEFPAQIRSVGLQSAAVGGMLAIVAWDLAHTESGLTLPAGWIDDPVDAFRHCYWSCRMTQEIGVRKAGLVTDIHELCNPKGPSLMDYFNNYVGRSIASGNPSCNCEAECLYAAWTGRLQLHP